MAGMTDNPLVGDYSKGVSRGGLKTREYFVDLILRAQYEKISPKVIASDLRDFMGMNARAAVGNQAKKQSLENETVNKPSGVETTKPAKAAPSKWTKVALAELRMHFG